MGFKSVFAVLLFGFIGQLSAASADQVTGPVIDPDHDQVVPTSCTASSLGSNWCECTLISPYGGTFTAAITCDATLCYHMKDWRNIEGCLSPPAVYHCELSRGPATCTEQVAVDGVKVKTAADACSYILSRLNFWDTGAPVFYCNDTYLRGGWQLDSIH